MQSGTELVSATSRDGVGVIRQMLDRIQNATPNQQQQAAPNARD